MAYEVLLLDPAVDFLRSTEPKLRAKAFRTIELLRELNRALRLKSEYEEDNQQ
jgi:hypothetical protein